MTAEERREAVFRLVKELGPTEFVRRASIAMIPKFTGGPTFHGGPSAAADKGRDPLPLAPVGLSSPDAAGNPPGRATYEGEIAAMRIDGVDTYDMLGDQVTPAERAVAQAIYGAHRYHFTPLELATTRRALEAAARGADA